MLGCRVKDGQDRADEIQAFNHLASSIENLLLKKGVPRDQASELFQDFSDGLNITRWVEMNMKQLLYAGQMYTSTMGHDNANTSRVKGHILNMVRNKGRSNCWLWMFNAVISGARMLLVRCAFRCVAAPLLDVLAVICLASLTNDGTWLPHNRVRYMIDHMLLALPL